MASGTGFVGRLVAIVEKHTFRGPVEILVLPASERPEERPQADDAESQRDGKQDGHVHRLAGSASAEWISPSGRRACRRRPDFPSLSAFAITRIEDSDMASAAISGVTYPRIAMGTTTAL